MQQFSGQNSINYYAPDIFASIGITGQNTSLLASGIYGIVKIVATAIFVVFGIEKFGRRWSLVIGLALMSLFLWFIGAIFNTNRKSTSELSKEVGLDARQPLFEMRILFLLLLSPWQLLSTSMSSHTVSLLAPLPVRLSIV